MKRSITGRSTGISGVSGVGQWSLVRSDALCTDRRQRLPDLAQWLARGLRCFPELDRLIPRTLLRDVRRRAVVECSSAIDSTGRRIPFFSVMEEKCGLSPHEQVVDLTTVVFSKTRSKRAGSKVGDANAGQRRHRIDDAPFADRFQPVTHGANDGRIEHFAARCSRRFAC